MEPISVAPTLFRSIHFTQIVRTYVNILSNVIQLRFFPRNFHNDSRQFAHCSTKDRVSGSIIWDNIRYNSRLLRALNFLFEYFCSRFSRRDAAKANCQSLICRMTFFCKVTQHLHITMRKDYIRQNKCCAFDICRMFMKAREMLNPVFKIG